MEALKQPFNPRPRELDPVEGVNWGNQATLRLVSGPTYQNIELVTDITDPSDIERITVKVNGREIVNVTAQDLIDLQEHKKSTCNKVVTCSTSLICRCAPNWVSVQVS